MEGIVALSLACNIVQVVGYGITAVEVITQVYRYGRTVDNAAIESTTKRLQELCQALEPQVNSTQVNSTTLEKHLQQIVHQSTTVASELIQELSKLSANGSTWTKLKAGVLAAKKRAKVEKLRQQLSDCERTINTGILATLREQNEAAKVMQLKSFGNLDSSLQCFIVRLSQGQAQTADLIKVENETTRALVIQAADTLGSQIDSVETSRRRTQMLNSLRYPEMHARLNRVEDASPGTFDALVESPTHGILSEWLKESSGVLWIQGKAGSGKSTLMKFIAQSTNIPSFIGKKKPKFATLNHFFWLSGSPLQRDLRGLLCSLAYQLTGLIDDIRFKDKLHIDDWSIGELEALVLSSLDLLAVDTTTIILLDALDEYDEQCDQRKLLRLINRFSHHVSVCVSSRPEPFWIKNLQYNCHVRLEDITKDAIETFIRQELEDLRSNDSSRLISALTDQADGVFLWAHIAVKDVRRGLDSNATDEELWQRIKRLPRGMENLYKEMLGRVEEDWPLLRLEAALFFSVALLLSHMRGFGIPKYSSEGCLYQYHVAVRIFLTHQPAEEDEESLTKETMRLKDRITYVCAGLIEPMEFEGSDLYRTPGRATLFMPVAFTHRTARDFLLDVPFGRALTQSDAWKPATFVCELIRTQGLLYQSGLSYMDWSSVQSMLTTIMTVHLVLDMEDIDCLKMIIVTGELLERLLPPKSHPMSGPIQFVHRNSIFPHRLRSVDFYLSFDFLGLTLHSGTMCYFNHLCLDLEALTIQYMDYLLLCAGARTITPFLQTTSYLRDRQFVYGDVLKLVGQYGAKGESEIWLEENVNWVDCHMFKTTATEQFLGQLLLQDRQKIDDRTCKAIQQLWTSNLANSNNNTYSFVVDCFAFFKGHDLELSLSNIMSQHFYIEGNLQWWVSLFHSCSNDSRHKNQCMHLESLQDMVPFRRLRFVWDGSHNKSSRSIYGVPVLIKGQTASSVENGEKLLQLFETFIRAFRLNDNSRHDEQHTERIRQEADRLLQSIAGQLRTTAKESSEIRDLVSDDRGLIGLIDYLEHEGVMRKKTEADENFRIPVFKES